MIYNMVKGERDFLYIGIRKGQRMNMSPSSLLFYALLLSFNHPISTFVSVSPISSFQNSSHSSQPSNIEYNSSSPMIYHNILSTAQGSEKSVLTTPKLSCSYSLTVWIASNTPNSSNLSMAFFVQHS